MKQKLPLTILFASAMLAFALLPASKASADTLQITTASLPNATIGKAYSTQIEVSVGASPYTWSTVSTTYPSGCCVLGLTNNTQPISGNSVTFNTQSSATVISNHTGTYSWTFQVRDASGSAVTKTLSLNVSSDLQITTTNLPAATAGQPYTTQIQATGGTAPYTWI